MGTGGLICPTHEMRTEASSPLINPEGANTSIKQGLPQHPLGNYSFPFNLPKITQKVTKALLGYVIAVLLLSYTSPMYFSSSTPFLSPSSVGLGLPSLNDMALLRFPDSPRHNFGVKQPAHDAKSAVTSRQTETFRTSELNNSLGRLLRPPQLETWKKEVSGMPAHVQGEQANSTGANVCAGWPELTSTAVLGDGTLSTGPKYGATRNTGSLNLRPSNGVLLSTAQPASDRVTVTSPTPFSSPDYALEVASLAYIGIDSGASEPWFPSLHGLVMVTPATEADNPDAATTAWSAELAASTSDSSEVNGRWDLSSHSPQSRQESVDLGLSASQPASRPDMPLSSTQSLCSDSGNEHDNPYTANRYEIERFAGHRVGQDSIVEFRVQWRGLPEPEPTWELEDHMHHDVPGLVKAYWGARGGRDKALNLGPESAFHVHKIWSVDRKRVTLEWTGYPGEQYTEPLSWAKREIPHLLHDFSEHQRCRGHVAKKRRAGRNEVSGLPPAKQLRLSQG